MAEARSIRSPLPGEQRDADWQRKAVEDARARGQDVDYADELLGTTRAVRSTMDVVSRAVVLAGGSSVYWENPRPDWSRPERKLEGELPGEPLRFDRMYRMPGGVDLYVDVMRGDPVDAWQAGSDAGWAEQRRRGGMCRQAGRRRVPVRRRLAARRGDRRGRQGRHRGAGGGAGEAGHGEEVKRAAPLQCGPYASSNSASALTIASRRSAPLGCL